MNEQTKAEEPCDVNELRAQLAARGPAPKRPALVATATPLATAAPADVDDLDEEDEYPVADESAGQANGVANGTGERSPALYPTGEATFAWARCYDSLKIGGGSLELDTGRRAMHLLLSPGSDDLFFQLINEARRQFEEHLLGVLRGKLASSEEQREVWRLAEKVATGRLETAGLERQMKRLELDRADIIAGTSTGEKAAQDLGKVEADLAALTKRVDGAKRGLQAWERLLAEARAKSKVLLEKLVGESVLPERQAAVAKSDAEVALFIERNQGAFRALFMRAATHYLSIDSAGWTRTALRLLQEKPPTPQQESK